LKIRKEKKTNKSNEIILNKKHKQKQKQQEQTKNREKETEQLVETRKLILIPVDRTRKLIPRSTSNDKKTKFN